MGEGELKEGALEDPTNSSVTGLRARTAGAPSAVPLPLAPKEAAAVSPSGGTASQPA